MKERTWVLRIRKSDGHIFDGLKDGLKKVETRAAGGRYDGVKAGDKLIFLFQGRRLEKKIVSVRKFRSLQELIRAHRIPEINPQAKSEGDLRMMYGSFPGYLEKIKKAGVIAFRLR